MNPYVRAAIDSETATLCRSSSGRRACATFRAAAALGNLVGAGELDRADTECLLLAAALQTGLPEREAIHHVRRGIRHGEKTPRSVPDPRPIGRCSAPFGQSHAIATAGPVGSDGPPTRPPLAEVADLWNASHPVNTDSETSGWFARRYAERAASFLEHAELWDLVRAIPRDVRLPRWAWSHGGSWIQTGHRLLFRLWDHAGQAVSVRARCVDPTTMPKSLAPSGFSVKGLVLADPLAVQLLSGICPTWWAPREVVICEGEPDTLLWVARQREADEEGPACIGIDAGAWSQRIANRIPDGARVAIRVHHDAPGEVYARQIAGSLSGRCQIFRSKVGEEGASK